MAGDGGYSHNSLVVVQLPLELSLLPPLTVTAAVAATATANTFAAVATAAAAAAAIAAATGVLHGVDTLPSHRRPFATRFQVSVYWCEEV